MSTLTYTTFAAVAEDQYRRERASHDLHAAGGARHHRRFTTWRDRRRNGTSTAK